MDPHRLCCSSSAMPHASPLPAGNMQRPSACFRGSHSSNSSSSRSSSCSMQVALFPNASATRRRWNRRPLHSKAARCSLKSSRQQRMVDETKTQPWPLPCTTSMYSAAPCTKSSSLVCHSSTLALPSPVQSFRTVAAAATPRHSPPSTSSPLSSSPSSSPLSASAAQSTEAAVEGLEGTGSNLEAAASTPGCGASSFSSFLREKGLPSLLTRRGIGTVQLNIGLYCNQACAHCHVDSSPLRTEMMDRSTAEKIVQLLQRSPSVHTVDLTGGAPELNAQFRFLVDSATLLGLTVIDRCNLTVLQEPGQEDLAAYLAERQVRIVASLPCYSPANVNQQRGGGVFDRSIEALQLLNSLGYGSDNSPLILDLVYNPLGPSLPPFQKKLQQAYKKELLDCYGIHFNNLFTITNMPIKRFGDDLERKGHLESYMELLKSSFNAAAVDNVMCRDLISVRWDGALFDCDFNQQLAMPLPSSPFSPRSVFELESFEDLVDLPISIGSHCFGCTAGQGSSCTGAVAEA